MISELCQTTKQNISLHIRNILAGRELDNSAVKEYLATAIDGKSIAIPLFSAVA